MAAVNIPKLGAKKYTQMPCHIQANKADENDLAGLTLKPEIEEASPKYETVTSATKNGVKRARR